MTIVTIAFAVAGLWIFAMPVLMDRAMDQRVVQDRLHDVQLSTSDVVLDAKSLAALRAVPGVRALDTRTIYGTRILDHGRRDDVFLVGVSDWGHQPVNAISVDSGAAPRGAQVVTDRMNARTGRYSGGIGAQVQIADVHGRPHPVAVSGRGDTMMFSQIVADDRAVLYAPQSTVNGLAGASGVNSIELRVDDPKHAEAVAAAVRSRLLALNPSVTFTDLPDVRQAGSWPGQDVFNNFSTLLYVGAVLALISALVLISNTMTTMVAEQTRQIAMMKAIGGRRRQIRRSYLRTALLLGVAGTVVGIAIGIPFANLALGFIGDRFFGVNPGWGVPTNAIIISIVVGLGATLLASLPSLRRAARTSVRAGLESGVTAGGDGRLDRLLRRVRLPRTTQIGLRNVTRRRTAFTGHDAADRAGGQRRARLPRTRRDGRGRDREGLGLDALGHDRVAARRTCPSTPAPPASSRRRRASRRATRSSTTRSRWTAPSTSRGGCPRRASSTTRPSSRDAGCNKATRPTGATSWWSGARSRPRRACTSARR